MKISASKAWIYVGLIDLFLSDFEVAFERRLSEAVTIAIMQLCNVEGFEVEEEDYGPLILACAFWILSTNHVLEDSAQYKQSLLEWSHTDAGPFEAQLHQIIHLNRPHVDLGVSGAHGKGLTWINFDNQLDAAPIVNEGESLLEILDRYPETDEGYRGVMAEVALLLAHYEAKLGPKLALVEENNQYNLWYYWQARPYMRLLFELMDFHRALDMLDEAIAYGKKLLHLSDQDNLNVHEVLIPLAIQIQDDDLVEQLLQRFENDDLAGMYYNRALYGFSKRSEDAQMWLIKAFEANTFVPAYLLGLKSLPYDSDYLPDRFMPGDETEAILYTYNARDAWLEVPGAITFLQQTKKRSQQDHKVIAFKKRGK